jgi:hypothetical protein
VHNCAHHMSRPAADECPYRRPFPPGFRDCPAYRSTRLVALDSRYRPLRPERTCNHLEVGTRDTLGRFYARCAVGTAEDRRRWADPEREAQVAEAAAVGAAMEQSTAALVDRLWESKGRQLRAMSDGDPAELEAATRELRLHARQALQAIDAVMHQEAERLARLNLPVDTTMEFLTAVVERFVEQRSAEPPSYPDEWVERFPEQAWWLLRPRAAAVPRGGG